MSYPFFGTFVLFKMIKKACCLKLAFMWLYR